MKNYLNLVAILSIIALMTSCEKEEDKVKACFDYAITEVGIGEVEFKNCSQNATSYHWDFGDGQTSTEKNPIHTFNTTYASSLEMGYTVKLTAKNGKHSDTTSMVVIYNVRLYKPNIYIYPENKLKLTVKIDFPMGGEVVESIPQYNNGWTVNIEPNGMIDNQYTYLFYESDQPNMFQYAKGWCVKQADLKQFFEHNMKLYSFSETEIKDFTDYWIPILNEHNYYLIYPQTNTIINKIVQLNFSTQPTNVNRLFYGAIGCNQHKTIEAPAIENFKREGFFVMEWGVFTQN